MSDDIKFVIAEVNKVLNKSYNLISFDALSSEDLLQVRSDSLPQEQTLNFLIEFKIL